MQGGYLDVCFSALRITLFILQSCASGGPDFRDQKIAWPGKYTLNSKASNAAKSKQ